MSVIRWEDLPSLTREYDWAAIVTELRSQPGNWAVIGVAHSAGLAGSMALNIRKSKYVPLRGHRFEAVARTVNGEHRIYARYVGDPS